MKLLKEVVTTINVNKQKSNIVSIKSISSNNFFRKQQNNKFHIPEGIEKNKKQNAENEQEIYNVSLNEENNIDSNIHTLRYLNSNLKSQDKDIMFSTLNKQETNNHIFYNLLESTSRNRNADEQKMMQTIQSSQSRMIKTNTLSQSKEVKTCEMKFQNDHQKRLKPKIFNNKH